MHAEVAYIWSFTDMYTQTGNFSSETTLQVTYTLQMKRWV